MHGDRPARGHGFAVHRTTAVDQHPPSGELGQELVDRIVEPELAVLHQQHGRRRHDRLRHRGDAKDAVAAYWRLLSTGEVTGDANLDLVASGGKPGNASDAVVGHMTSDDFTETTYAGRIESPHDCLTLRRTGTHREWDRPE